MDKNLLKKIVKLSITSLLSLILLPIVPRIYVSMADRFLADYNIYRTIVAILGIVIISTVIVIFIIRQIQQLLIAINCLSVSPYEWDDSENIEFKKGMKKTYNCVIFVFFIWLIIDLVIKFLIS